MKTSATLMPLLLAVGLAAGCNSWVDKHGTAPDVIGFDEDAIDVVLPANASSIRRHYRGVDPQKSQKEVGEEHLGIDILARVGTPVIAPAGGRVIGSFFEPLYGHHVVIDHGTDEEGLRINTRFLHLDERLVRVGDVVVRGQQIGALGRTGLLAGLIPHLHYELAREDEDGRITAMDPNVYWMDGVGRVTCFDKDKQWPERPFRTVYPVVCRDDETL